MRTALEFLGIGLAALSIGALLARLERPRPAPIQVPWAVVAERKLLLVDARSSGDYARGHLDGAVSLPGEGEVLVPVELRQGEVVVYGNSRHFEAVVKTADALAAYREKPVMLVIDAPLPR